MVVGAFGEQCVVTREFDVKCSVVDVVNGVVATVDGLVNVLEFEVQDAPEFGRNDERASSEVGNEISRERISSWTRFCSQKKKIYSG